MASDKPYNWSATSAAQKNILLPVKFLCRNCKKFKSPPQFSNKELGGFRWKKSNRIAVNEISAKLRCRTCSGDQTSELQCNGPCGLWKGLDEFSKNQRRSPENAWCSVCTQWKEANEPGVTPMPAPNTVLSPDEERIVAEDETGFAPYSIEDLEGEADSDEDGDGDFIYNSMSSMSIGGAANTSSMPVKGGDGNEASTTHDTGDGYIPPHIRGADTTSIPTKSFSSLNNPYETRTEYISEGGRSGPAISMETRLTKPVNSKTQTNISGSGWYAADARRRGLGLSYNAWDNLGQVHSQFWVSSTSGVSSNTAQSSSATPPIPCGRTGGWAKLPPSARNPHPPQFPTMRRPVQQATNDDDDSPDEI